MNRGKDQRCFKIPPVSQTIHPHIHVCICIYMCVYVYGTSTRTCTHTSLSLRTRGASKGPPSVSLTDLQTNAQAHTLMHTSEAHTLVIHTSLGLRTRGASKGPPVSLTDSDGKRFSTTSEIRPPCTGVQSGLCVYVCVCIGMRIFVCVIVYVVTCTGVQCICMCVYVCAYV